MDAETRPAILWLRRDLRITDHLALASAARQRTPVIPVYVVSTWRDNHAWTGDKRQHFLCECLASLAHSLEQLGGRLIIRRGDPVAEIETLASETGAASVHFTLDPDPFGRSTETRLRESCRRLKLECHGHHDTTLHQPDEILNQSGRPYRVFTPYLKNWLSRPKAPPLKAPREIHTPAGIHSLPLPTLASWDLPPLHATLPAAGEKAAKARLRNACSKLIQHYDARRDFPGLDATTRISQDLRFGLLSIRTVYQTAMRARQSASPAAAASIDTFISELAWREFYFAILHHFPDVLNTEFNPNWRGIPWREPGPGFDAWKSGRTGFPIVDAGMRELLATGFMHNRVRMITAMFLTKDLHLDWKLGESHFMRHLIDGEIASNNGGWQWSAGTGADAAPYFRIQNPWSQSARYDSDGTYIKKWIPELAGTHPSQFHQAPKTGTPIASGYPLPILDHNTERKVTLDIFKRHREQTNHQ